MVKIFRYIDVIPACRSRMLSGFLKKPEGLRIPNAFGTMTESDMNVALLMTVLVASDLTMLLEFDKF